MAYEDVEEKQWVLVKYKDDTFIGRVTYKGKNHDGECQYAVRCLTHPYGVGEPQEMEKDTILYDRVFHTDTLPYLVQNEQNKREERYWMY